MRQSVIRLVGRDGTRVPGDAQSARSGTARDRPAKGGARRRKDRGRCRKDARACLDGTSRTFLLGPPLPCVIACVRVPCGPRGTAGNGRGRAANGGRMAKGVKSAPPAADACSGTTRPPCERCGRGRPAGEEPAVSGPMECDGLCGASRRVRVKPRVRRCRGATLCGSSGSRTTTGGGHTATRAGPPRPGGFRRGLARRAWVTPRASRRPPAGSTIRRRDERRRLTRITRTSACDASRTTEVRVDRDGPHTDRAE